jgi:hypothetical protein
VNVRDGRAAAADFLRNFGVGYPSIYDPSQRLGLALKGIPLATVPITVVIDGRQRVAAVYLGAVLETDALPIMRRVATE